MQRLSLNAASRFCSYVLDEDVITSYSIHYTKLYESAQVAMDMLAGRLQFSAVVPDIVAYYLLWALLFVLPLLFFTPRLIRAKREGLMAYGKLGEVLFGGFQDKWAGVATRITSYNVCYTKLLRGPGRWSAGRNPPAP